MQTIYVNYNVVYNGKSSETGKPANQPTQLLLYHLIAETENGQKLTVFFPCSLLEKFQLFANLFGSYGDERALVMGGWSLDGLQNEWKD